MPASASQCTDRSCSDISSAREAMARQGSNTFEQTFRGIFTSNVDQLKRLNTLQTSFLFLILLELSHVSLPHANRVMKIEFDPSSRRSQTGMAMVVFIRVGTATVLVLQALEIVVYKPLFQGLCRGCDRRLLERHLLCTHWLPCSMR